MSVQLSTAVRNARLDAVETTIGTSPKLQLRSGTQPANCAASATGTLLAEITCPSDWAAAASGGMKAIAGSWTTTGLSAAGAGTTVGHYRLLNSAGSTCHEQGSVTAIGGGGDLTLDDVTIATGQTVTITTWTRTDANQ